MSLKRTVFPASVTLAVALAIAPSTARADDTIKHPGDHPVYNVEAEPHVLLGWDDIYASGGIGLGGRFTIPLVHNGFVETINNSVGIGFGMDVLHYDDARYHLNSSSANYFFFPVVMQWNFFVQQRWSVFGEPGLTLFHGFVSDCPAGVTNCGGPSVNGVRPALWLGGRYHINENVALTMRIGWPNFSVGVSFFL
jgi:hypothetical protein